MDTKELRYQVMLGLYLPMLLYAFSTYDLSEDTYAVESVKPVVVAPASVALGQPFDADVMLAVGGTSGSRPQLGSRGGAVEVRGDSALHMATGALLGDDEDERTVGYAATYRFSQVGGAVAEIPVEGSFTVRRPEIVARSGQLSALYRQSLNRVRLSVPELGGRSLLLRSSGQEVEGSSIDLVPAGSEVAVDVYLPAVDGGAPVRLGRRTFPVIDPPRPTLRVLHQGRELPSGEALPLGRATLQFQVVPDASYKERFPRDARYRVGRATVHLRRGLSVSEEIGTFDVQGGGRLVLTRALRSAKPGDRLIVTLGGVSRINHAGRALPSGLSGGALTYSFTLR